MRNYIDSNINQKRILVIGATSTIIADFLHSLKDKGAIVDVILRNKESKLSEEVNVIGCYNLASKEEVLSLIETIKDRKYDYFYYNASTAGSYNECFMVNFYSFYMIVNKLRDNFNKIVVTGSISYLNISLLKKNKSTVLNNYRLTKKMIMLYAYYNLNGIDTSIVHPGLCYTKLFKKLHPSLTCFRLLLNSPKKAGVPFAYALNKVEKGYMVGPGMFKPKEKKLKLKKFNYNEYMALLEIIHKYEGELC